MDALDIAILKFFSMFHFGTPKQLIDTIYPDFERYYPDKESFRIIIHRRLKRLPIKNLCYVVFIHAQNMRKIFTNT